MNNKQFNTYKEGLDLEFLREYCMEHGERRTFLRGETLEEAVETVAAGDLVGCYPYCLDGDAAPVTIRADKSSTVYVVDGADLNEHYRQSQAAERMGRDYMAYRLEQVKSQIYSHYCEKGVRDV